ncbi:Arm DNA-binding domain-containing protein, partial [Enterococcus faecium]|uniref:Arm DNA-binding domain-containing protein n=1 Tax=Enterococcus faecium TaxID=1352 RepID=UPI003F4244B8
KLWRLAYRFNGKQKILSLGAYPVVSLADARQARTDAKRLLSQGRDPSDVRRAEREAKKMAASNDFASIAKECLGKWKAEGQAAATL